MKVQEHTSGALYVYLSKDDCEELGIKKGDRLKNCVVNGTIILRKRQFGGGVN